MILRRIEGDWHSEVVPLWRGLTTVLIASGPSLTHEQVRRVRAARETCAVRVIAVNDAYLLAPWADVHYAADEHWRSWQVEGKAKPLLGLSGEDVKARWASFAGQKCGIDSGNGPPADDAVHVLRKHQTPQNFGLSLDPREIVTGRNSGFQALNVAVLAGAKRVILLGYDGKKDEGGKRHFFGDHPKVEADVVYPVYCQAMSKAENSLRDAGVEVVNCSPGSAIESFPKMDLREAL